MKTLEVEAKANAAKSEAVLAEDANNSGRRLVKNKVQNNIKK